ncbi:hypothetical protein HDU92_007298 [Lobulomyces angularis]|nr:hypothetical protein HDU92_007298 [Lobulomyces angularis]
MKIKIHWQWKGSKFFVKLILASSLFILLLLRTNSKSHFLKKNGIVFIKSKDLYPIAKNDFERLQEQQDQELWGFAINCSVIYTWVNGSIKSHQDEFNKYRVKYGAHEKSFQRYRDNEELKHSLRSYAKHMSWHKGQIYLVVPDGHVPNWLNTKHPRVTIINQSTLMDEEDNPTFNSNAIEQNFYRIPNISELFIQINDDTFFGSNLVYEDFFTKDRGNNIFMDNIKTDLEKHYNALWTSRQTTYRALINQFNCSLPMFSTRHAPIVYHREAFLIMHRLFKKELKETASRKFRNRYDLITPILHHYTVMNYKDDGEDSMTENSEPYRSGKGKLKFNFKNFKQEEMKLTHFFKPVTDNFESDLNSFKFFSEYKPKFFTLNDDFESESVHYLMKLFLFNMFPEKSPFEI